MVAPNRDSEVAVTSADVEDLESVNQRFEQMLVRYRKALKASIFRVVSPSSGISTDDVEQDASIRLWRAIADGRQIDNPGAYIYRVGMAAAIDAIRQVKARREEVLDDDNLRTRSAPDRDPEMAVRDRQQLERAASVLAELPDDRRRVVGLSSTLR